LVLGFDPGYSTGGVLLTQGDDRAPKNLISNDEPALPMSWVANPAGVPEQYQDFNQDFHYQIADYRRAQLALCESLPRPTGVVVGHCGYLEYGILNSIDQFRFVAASYDFKLLESRSV